MPVEQLSVENLERGYAGTAKTVDKMHSLVTAGKLDPTIQKIASWIRLEVPGDYFGQTRKMADVIFRWVKTHGVFQRDPFQLERISHPLSTMLPIIAAKKAGKYSGPGLFQGDCDDYSIWVATLGGILGFQYQFSTAKTDDSRPDEFSHIWAELLVDDQWYPLDASTPSAYPGWRPPVSADRIKGWPEKHIEETAGMRGLGRYGMGDGTNGQGDAWVDRKYTPQGDPARIDDLAPDQPAASFGEMLKVSEEIYRAPARKPYQRDALIETEEQVPRYQNWGAETVKQISVSTPYPYDWPWARQVEVVYPGVVSLNGMSGLNGFKRRLRQHAPPSHPGLKYAARQKPGGMGAWPESGGTTPIYDDTKAEVVQDSTTKTVFQGIDNVFSSIFGVMTEKQKADAEKYKRDAAIAVANATASASGSGPRTPTSEKSSPYTLPLVIGGGAVTVGLIAYFLTR